MSQPPYSRNDAMRGLPRMRQFRNGVQRARRTLARWCRGSFLQTMFDDYHPERHYMRGAGPKSRVGKPDDNAGSQRT